MFDLNTMRSRTGDLCSLMGVIGGNRLSRRLNSFRATNPSKIATGEQCFDLPGKSELFRDLGVASP